jgi:hypothetical protein
MLVQAVLTPLMEERQQRLDISAARVLQQLARIASFDPRKAFPSRRIVEKACHVEVDTAAAIAEFEIASFSKMPGKSRRRSS